MDSTVTVQLFAEARAGSSEAMDALYRRAAARLLPFIRVRLGRSLRAEAESRDILQSVLLKSVQKLDQVQDGGALMGWLIRIAENEIRDLADYATRQRRDVAERRPIEDAAGVPAVIRQALSQAILNEDTSRLERALAALTDTQREIVILRAFEELPFGDIAARVGKTTDACRMTYARALAAMTIHMRGSQ
jgi:RNA polymerase sigma-70 factor (ECF subfamily)